MMKKFTIALSALLFLYPFEGNSQSPKAISKFKIFTTLREKVVPNIHFTMEKDYGFINLLNVNQGIGINKSIKKESFFDNINKKNKGPYIGPIFWVYDFEKISSSTATIQQDSTGTVQLQLLFNTPDTIIINVKKNTHSCVTRPIDVSPHKILWTGEHSIAIALKPVQEVNQILLKVLHVAVLGVLKREDQFDLAPNFRSSLEDTLKKEFIKVFQNPEVINALHEILTADH